MVGVLYGLLIGFFVLVSHALFLAYVRSNGVRVGPSQLPELHARIENAARRLGLAHLPEVYVLQSHGVLNAFATKFFSRRYVVLLSGLIDQCQDPRQLDFVIAHELAHMAAGHVARQTFLLPYRVMPWLGAAYSRACEYTCDRCGLAVVGELEVAQRGLLVLAAGGQLAGSVNLAAFLDQRRDSGTFWSTVLELTSYHPYLTKRAGTLADFAAPGSVMPIKRSFWGWLLAPVLGGLGTTAGGAGPLMMVAVIGVLAAIAIPNFIRYQLRAKDSGAPEALRSLHAAELGLLAAKGSFVPMEVGAGRPGTTPQAWTPEDQEAAGSLGWTLNARDYRAYTVATGRTRDGKQAFAACAESDLDGDGVAAAWMIWEPVDDGEGNLVAPGAPCRFSPSLNRSDKFQPGDRPGVPVRVSADTVF
jgi:type II secretory pathway pseudopilin PulG